MKEEKKTEAKAVKAAKEPEEKKIMLEKGESKLLALIKAKRHPEFSGSFGNRSLRRKKSSRQWAKWRKPRGQSSTKKLGQREDGAKPKTGYGTNRLVKFLHPSGFPEVIVFNEGNLNAGLKGKALRIASAVGKKKRQEIMKKANELNLRVVNRQL